MPREGIRLLLFFATRVVLAARPTLFASVAAIVELLSGPSRLQPERWPAAELPAANTGCKARRVQHETLAALRAALELRPPRAWPQPQWRSTIASPGRVFPANLQVAAFLARHGGSFVLEPPPAAARLPAECLSPDGCLTMLPHVHKTDGAFAARLRRVDGSAGGAGGGSRDGSSADMP